MNSIQIIGYAAIDPKATHTNKDGIVDCVNLVVAVNRTFKRLNDPDVDFFKCTAFGKKAEIITRYVDKGDRIGLEGRMQFGSYEKDGTKVYTTELMVKEVHLLATKKEAVGKEVTKDVPLGGTTTTITDEVLPF